MDMFGLGKSSPKKFEKRYLNSKQTGMTIEDFERDHLKNVVHAYYMCQDVTEQSFKRYEQQAVELDGTPEGDYATMATGFLVGINDGIHDPSIEFMVFDDLKVKQRNGWAHLIGDESRNVVGAVETLYEYALARRLSPAEILAKFPRAEFEAAFAAYAAKEDAK